jgi:hypothetical protein
MTPESINDRDRLRVPPHSPIRFSLPGELELEVRISWAPSGKGMRKQSVLRLRAARGT